MTHPQNDDHLSGTLLGITITVGQRNESIEFETLIDHCQRSLHRYTRRPEAIAGDKGYSTSAIREHLAWRLIEPVVASRSNEGHEESFDREAYRQRNIVERLIGWLKESRRIATRYDKLPCSYFAFLYLAALQRAAQLL